LLSITYFGQQMTEAQNLTIKNSKVKVIAHFYKMFYIENLKLW